MITHNIREFSRVPGLVLEDWELDKANRINPARIWLLGGFIQESPEVYLTRLGAL